MKEKCMKPASFTVMVISKWFFPTGGNSTEEINNLSVCINCDLRAVKKSVFFFDKSKGDCCCIFFCYTTNFINDITILCD